MVQIHQNATPSYVFSETLLEFILVMKHVHQPSTPECSEGILSNSLWSWNDHCNAKIDTQWRLDRQMHRVNQDEYNNSRPESTPALLLLLILGHLHLKQIHLAIVLPSPSLNPQHWQHIGPLWVQIWCCTRDPELNSRPPNNLNHDGKRPASGGAQIELNNYYWLPTFAKIRSGAFNSCRIGFK
jgi:uncharacterized protein (DUF983 family)